MTQFVALGDSITVGIGDPVRPARKAGRPDRGDEVDGATLTQLPAPATAVTGTQPPWRGWAALLAEGLREPGLHILAASGACAADVERDQLPRALELRPDIASVIIGVNDTLRSNFDADRVAGSAGRTVEALRSAGAAVLTMRLPDPGRMLGLPGVLARPLARRAGQINQIMDVVADRYGTLHFDAANDAATYDPRMWAVDRLHPSERGHRLIARRFHAMIEAAGLPVGPEPDPEPTNPPPSKLAELAWLATKGSVWVVRRSTDLVPNLVGMAVAEWRAGQALAAPGPAARSELEAEEVA